MESQIVVDLNFSLPYHGALFLMWVGDSSAGIPSSRCVKESLYLA